MVGLSFPCHIAGKTVSKIEGLYYGVIGVFGYFTILISGIGVFFIRRKRYTGWFPRFYDRVEKFYSEYDVWRKYSVEKGYDTIDAIIAYGNENQSSFVKKFSCTRLTREEEKEKKSKIVAAWLMTIIGANRNLVPDHFTAGEHCVRNREKRNKGKMSKTAAVSEKVQAAINEKRPGPADGIREFTAMQI